MQQGDNMMETADMTMNGCSLSGPEGPWRTQQHIRTHKIKVGVVPARRLVYMAFFAQKGV